MHTHWIRQVIIPVVDFIYPPVCRICTAALSGSETVVCAACWRSFRQVSPGHPVWEEIRAKMCEGGTVDELFSCFLFEKEGALQNVIHLLKYGGVKSIGVRLGKEIGARYLDRPEPLHADIVMPVPLHRRKKRERGYNQSDYLCKGFAEATRLPVVNSLLVRNRFTVSQTQLGIHERKENVAGAFSLTPRSERFLEGKTVLLIDDVITTGSTLGACATVLRKGGAVCVVAASVALAQ